MDKKLWKRVVLFGLAVAVMFALLLLRSTNEYDREFTRMKLPKNGTAYYTVDLGRQGSLKYFVQPNIYTIYFRLQPQDKNAELVCHSEGMTMMLSQGSKKGIWKQVASAQVLRKERGTLPLSAELYVPREKVKQYDVGKGAIKFFEGDKLYAVIWVKVINSKYKEAK